MGTTEFDVSAEELIEFREQVGKLILAQHLYWVSWCVVMAKPMIMQVFKDECQDGVLKLVDDEEAIIKML